MKTLSLYRKRFIPDECILLKDDVIVKQNDDVIVTRWSTIHPKSKFSHGASCYFLKEGFKIGKFYREDGSLYCWYCDIVRYDYTGENELTVTDLLADVIIKADGVIRVVDLDELSDALNQGLITTELMDQALKQLQHLLDIIYAGNFSSLQEEINSLGL